MSQVNKVYFGKDNIIGYSEKNLCPVFDLIPNGETGITYIRNKDGSIRIFGTATARSVCYIIHPSSLYNIPAGTYSSGCTKNTNTAIFVTNICNTCFSIWN